MVLKCFITYKTVMGHCPYQNQYFWHACNSNWSLQYETKDYHTKILTKSDTFIVFLVFKGSTLWIKLIKLLKVQCKKGKQMLHYTHNQCVWFGTLIQLNFVIAKINIIKCFFVTFILLKFTNIIIMPSMYM